MIKLHLGCGTKHIDNYTNIDIRYLPGVDDFSKVYLPHLDDNGILMSLNIEATK
jgi:hypothetical protein